MYALHAYEYGCTLVSCVLLVGNCSRHVCSKCPRAKFSYFLCRALRMTQCTGNDLVSFAACLSRRQCGDHKGIGHRNLATKMCQHVDESHRTCSRVASYGQRGATAMRFCQEHKEPTDVNLRCAYACQSFVCGCVWVCVGVCVCMYACMRTHKTVASTAASSLGMHR